MANAALVKHYQVMTREQLEKERQKLKEEIEGPDMYTHSDSEHMRRTGLYKKAIIVEEMLYGEDAAKKLQAELYKNSRYQAETLEQKEERNKIYHMRKKFYHEYILPNKIG